jgi:hypothetical protein
MRRFTLRHTILAVAALAATTAGTTVAVAQLSGSDAADPLQRPNAVITQIDADQLAAFGVLRGESGAAADFTPAAADLVANGLGPDVGASAELSRRAGTASDGTPLFVVPGDGWLCLVSGDGGGGCNRTAEVLAGYGLTLQRHGDVVALQGIVPDGVSAVDVTGGADAAHLTATANVWSARLTFDPESVHWTGADGTAHDVPVSVPADLPTGPPPG